MGLNIKNSRVHELARQAAERFGMSQTSVIEEALTRMLKEVGPSGARLRADRIAGVLVEVDAALSDDDRAALRKAADALYDARGLPR